MKDDIFIGVDPGISGAIAAIRGDGTLIGSWDLPTVAASKGGKELHLTEIRRLEYSNFTFLFLEVFFIFLIGNFYCSGYG